MGPLDSLISAMFCGALLLAASILVPGAIVGLGAALIAKITIPTLRPKNLLAITLAWVLALTVGAYVGLLVGSLLAAALGKVIPHRSDSALLSFFLVLFYAIPLAVGGSIAGAIGTGVTFRFLRRADKTRAIDAA